MSDQGNLGKSAFKSRRLKASRAATGRATSRRGFVRSNKGADKLVFHLPSQLIDIEASTRQKGPSVFEAVNPRWLDVDIVKAGFGKFRYIFVIAQGTGDAAHPKLHVFLDFGRYVATTNNVGDGKPTAWFEHTKGFL